MNATHNAVVEPTGTAAKKSPPYRLYALLLAMIFAARIFALVTQDMEWTIRVYNSPIWFLVFLTLSIVLSIASGFYFKRHLPPAIAWLSCGLVGGICMLLINSIPGAIIGLCTGAVIIRHESIAAIGKSFMGYFGRTIVSSMYLGFVSGCVGAFVWFHWGAHRPGFIEWLSIALPAVLGTVISYFVLRRLFRERRWYGWVGAVMLFALMSSIGAYRQIAWEQDRITQKVSSISNAIVGSNGLSSLMLLFEPFPSQQLYNKWQGIERVLRKDWGFYFDWIVDIHLDADSSHAGIEQVSRLPFVASIYVGEGCQMTDAAFRKFNSRCLRYINIQPGTQIGADAFRSKDLTNLQGLTLSGENIDDEVLESIGRTPSLHEFSLHNTRVSVDGFERFLSGRQMPRLEVTRTPIGDDVFPVIAKCPNLKWIDLTGTNVDGSGLKHLRGSCHRLILDETPLNWSHLAGLLPPEGKKATPNNAFMLSQLSMRNTPFQAESIEVLQRLSEHVSDIDVGLNALPDEFFENKNLMLTSCGLDGLSVDPENIQRYGVVHLTLHFDAKKNTPDEIVSHVNAVCDAQFMQLMETAMEMRLPAPTQKQKGSVGVVVHGLKITEEALTTLEPLEEQQYAVELPNAIGPDGKEVQAHSIYYVRSLYRNLADTASD